MHNPHVATVGFEHSHKPVFTGVVSANCKPKWILPLSSFDTGSMPRAEPPSLKAAFDGRA